MYIDVYILKTSAVSGWAYLVSYIKRGRVPERMTNNAKKGDFDKKGDTCLFLRSGGFGALI